MNMLAPSHKQTWAQFY